MLRIASGLHGSVVGPGGHHVLKRVFAPHILLAGHHLLHQHHHFHLLHPRLALVLHGVFVVVGLVVVHLVLHHVLHDGGEAVGLLVVAGVIMAVMVLLVLVHDLHHLHHLHHLFHVVLLLLVGEAYQNVDELVHGAEYRQLQLGGVLLGALCHGFLHIDGVGFHVVLAPAGLQRLLLGPGLEHLTLVIVSEGGGGDEEQQELHGSCLGLRCGGP